MRVDSTRRSLFFTDSGCILLENNLTPEVPTMLPFIDLKYQYSLIRDEIHAGIDRVLES